MTSLDQIFVQTFAASFSSGISKLFLPISMLILLSSCVDLVSIPPSSIEASYQVSLEYINCADCKEANPFDDQTREFKGIARISSSQSNEEVHLDVGIANIPKTGKSYYPTSRFKTISLRDPSSSDFIRVVMNLTEMDTGNANDDFGTVNRTIYLDKFPQGGTYWEYNFTFKDRVGTLNEQIVGVRLGILRVK